MRTSNQFDWHWRDLRKDRGQWRSFICTHHRQMAGVRNWWWWVGSCLEMLTWHFITMFDWFLKNYLHFAYFCSMLVCKMYIEVYWSVALWSCLDFLLLHLLIWCYFVFCSTNLLFFLVILGLSLNGGIDSGY